MFSRFDTKDGGALYVRTVDVRRLQDATGLGFTTDDPENPTSFVFWEEGSEQKYERIQGTATENFDRLKQEELAMIAEAQRQEQRMQANLPIVPVQRGRLR